MFRLTCTRLRRSLALKGLTVASAVPEGASGRAEEATIRPALRVEDDRLAYHDVGPPLALTGTLAFLDGTQRTEIVAYSGSAPILAAEISAAVRERRDRILRTVASDRALLAIGRASALDAAGEALDGLERVDLDGASPHPIRDLVEARRKVDHRRGNLELSVGDEYRRRSPGWLLIDGSLGVSPGWAADPRIVGISKSHATLPFDSPELDLYLRLPAGHRTSIFEPAQGIAPVRAWALRLWPWEGKDLFHGLVRVEVAPVNGTGAIADEISRWVLAERAPLSDDPRADRLLYGIHSVEQYLRARATF